MIFPCTVWGLRDHSGHSRQASATAFPHVSLFTKGDDSAETVPVGCCFSRTCFGPFRSVAASSFDRIAPWNKHFFVSGFWPNCLSQCCVRRVSLRFQSTLIPFSPSIRPSRLQGLSPHTLFRGSKGWILPRPLHPMWNRGPQ